MRKELAVTLLLQLAGCNSKKSEQTDVVQRVEPDSSRASHCYAAHNAILFAMSRKQKASSSSPTATLALEIRAQWEFDKLRNGGLPQAEREELVKLSRQLASDPESAEELGRDCSDAEDRDPSFKRARDTLVDEINAPPEPTPTTRLLRSSIGS